MLIKRAHKAPPCYGYHNVSFFPSLPFPAWQQSVPDSYTAQQCPIKF